MAWSSEALGLRLPPPFKGPSIRIPIIIPIKGRGVD